MKMIPAVCITSMLLAAIAIPSAFAAGANYKVVATWKLGGDGGWDYVAERQERGHDLSLAVMQALALRSAVDSGLEVPPDVVEMITIAAPNSLQTNPSAQAMTNPTTQPSIACGPPIAAINAGIVMNGPMPIIVDMFNAVACSKPNRRCKPCAGD